MPRMGTAACKLAVHEEFPQAIGDTTDKQRYAPFARTPPTERSVISVISDGRPKRSGKPGHNPAPLLT